jgi:hypothetical protein
MSHKRCNLAWLGAALSLSATLFLVACADGVPLDELFPDAGHAGTHLGSAGSSTNEGNGLGSSGNIGPDMGGSGGGGSIDNGGAGSTGASGSSGNGSSSGGAGSMSGSGGSAAGGSGNHAGSTGSGGSTTGCAAPAWDSMTVYCGQGAVGTEVSLNGKKYACHYWTQAQNPEDHNSADNSEPWSTPSSCP